MGFPLSVFGQEMRGPARGRRRRGRPGTRVSGRNGAMLPQARGSAGCPARPAGDAWLGALRGTCASGSCPEQPLTTLQFPKYDRYDARFVRVRFAALPQ